MSGRRRHWPIAAAVLVILLVITWGRTGTPGPEDLPAPDSTAVAQARAAVATLAGGLQAQLFAALDRGGPAEAVATCADSAQAITARHWNAGLQVRRVGTRVRNAANAPDSLERAMLARFEVLRAAGTLPADTVLVVPGAEGRPELRLLKPIVVQDRCLSCHGDPAGIPDPVRGLIAARYPADSATGYRAGDLRGAVTVRMAFAAR